jgi:hypothetical protein
MLSRLLAQEQRQSFVDVIINLLELAQRVTYSKVGASVAKCLVDFGHDRPDGFWQAMSGSSDRSDLVANSLQRPLARPLLEVAFPPILPGLHFAAVEAEKVEALPVSPALLPTH